MEGKEAQKTCNAGKQLYKVYQAMHPTLFLASDWKWVGKIDLANIRGSASRLPH